MSRQEPCIGATSRTIQREKTATKRVSAWGFSGHIPVQDGLRKYCRSSWEIRR